MLPLPPRRHTTDQQRQAQAGRAYGPFRPTPVGDKVCLNRAVITIKVPKPVVVTNNTLLVRGGNGSEWKIILGKGNQLNIVDLTHFHLQNDIGHRVFDLSDFARFPDAIGLDFNVSGNASLASGVAGINILWHTRGEKLWYLPEIHWYKGKGPVVGKGVPISIGAGISASIFVGWATYFDAKGRRSPSSNAWVANGFNWTGYFWSVGASIPTPWGVSVAGSYFASDERYFTLATPTLTNVWWGLSLGISWSVPATAKFPTNFLTKTPVGASANLMKTDYSLIYGNGNDFNTKTKTPQDISGWHGLQMGSDIFHWTLGIDQNDYPDLP